MKISREFATRLEGRMPDETVRVVVMLETERPVKGAGRRALRAQRKAMAEAARVSVEAAAAEIAVILEKFGGRRLAGDLDILASLTVETTAAGIKAVAEIPRVRAIVEDQRISLISK